MRKPKYVAKKSHIPFCLAHLQTYNGGVKKTRAYIFKNMTKPIEGKWNILLSDVLTNTTQRRMEGLDRKTMSVQIFKKVCTCFLWSEWLRFALSNYVKVYL